jgi:hypothetical protein
MSTVPRRQASSSTRFDSPEQEAFLNLWRMLTACSDHRARSAN